eukprot:scaffold48038_cov18-Tisochrysis_lutea.AAC.1
MSEHVLQYLALALLASFALSLARSVLFRLCAMELGAADNAGTPLKLAAMLEHFWSKAGPFYCSYLDSVLCVEFHCLILMLVHMNAASIRFGITCIWKHSFTTAHPRSGFLKRGFFANLSPFHGAKSCKVICLGGLLHGKV